jgi:hypothetical protein
MSIMHTADAVELELDALPTSMVWRGTRWRVSDEPTRLEDLIWGLMHPPSLSGWRFQATNEQTRETLVFDVLSDASGWSLVRVVD